MVASPYSASSPEFHQVLVPHSTLRSGDGSPENRSIVGDYVLSNRIGRGGMGEVYLAEHRLHRHRCAVKLIRPDKSRDPRTITRFHSEVEAMLRLSHPNTVCVLDQGVAEDGTRFYVMEYLPGLDLEELVRRFGPLPPERVVYLLCQVCWALAEAHEKGLIHRDVKPANIVAVRDAGRYDVTKLLDFGLVTSLRTGELSHASRDCGFAGSPFFAAPECLARLDDTSLVDARSDIYSLGATAYYALTGRPVFDEQQTVRLMLAHATCSTVAPSRHGANIPQRLEAVIMKCLEKRPGDRYHSAVALEEALRGTDLLQQWTQQQARDWWEAHTPLLPPADHKATDRSTITVTVETR